MKAAFIIYCRAVGLYAILTLVMLARPEVYLISMAYVLIYGWFAWLAFTLIYLLLNRILFDFVLKLVVLFVAVIGAVLFAYYMIGLFSLSHEIWVSEFFVFPFLAIIAGWISVCVSRERIRRSCYAPENGPAV